MQCLDYDDEEKIIISLFYIDDILNKLNISAKESWIGAKILILLLNKNLILIKKFNSQLDKKYRKFKPKYLNFLQSDEFLEERKTVISNIAKSNLALQNIHHHHKYQTLEIPFRSLFQNIFHMNINRLFISNQCLFEIVIYNYLARYYKMAIFKN